MNDLLPVIEHIASLAHKTETDKWILAEAIHSAFVELPAYSHGLLSGLCERLKYEPANIYQYRNAWALASWHGRNKLSVSHYARMHDLSERYNLSPGDIQEYFELAESENLSVRKMVHEVESNHEPDPQGKYDKSIKRFIHLGRSILNDPLNRMEKPLYANLYDLIKELEKI